jgi:hypothetical protein
MYPRPSTPSLKDRYSTLFSRNDTHSGILLLKDKVKSAEMRSFTIEKERKMAT